MTRLNDVIEGKEENYILPFFWIREDDELENLKNELDKVYESGIRAICVEGRPHEQFGEQSWWDQMELILSECDRRGMRVWLLDDKKFPTGYANDYIPKKHPDYKRWGVLEYHVDVVGPVQEGAVLVNHIKKDPSDEIIAVLACEREENSERLTGRIIDITDNISGDFIYFDLPEGGYRIVFVIKNYTRFGERVTRIDMLSSQSTDVLIEAVYEPHYEKFSKYFGNTFAGFFSDEPCFDNNNAFEIELGTWAMHYPWHDDLMLMIAEKLGKRTEIVLPFLWFESMGDESAEFRVAYMDCITALYKKNFCEKLRLWCEERNVEYIGHVVEDNGIHTKTGGGAGHYFRAIDGQHIAGVDVVLNQIVPGQTKFPSAAPVCYQHADNVFFHYGLAKLASSHAAIQTIKQGRAMCEIFGAYGWAEGVKMMKWLTDHMLVRGINYFVPHAFSQRYPDPDCPPHFYATGKNPQFKQFGMLMQYMNRMCHLLNGGKGVVDVAIWYSAEGLWAGRGTPFEVAGKALYDNQIDFHVVPTDYLLQATTENGKMSLNENKYQCFIVPACEYIPNEVAQKLYKLARADVKVIYIGTAPKIIGGSTVEKCENTYILPIEELPKFMLKNNIIDFVAADENMFLRVYHYRQGEQNIYMLFNEDINHEIKTSFTVPCFSGGKYKIYNGMENELSVCESDKDIELNLSPYESVVYIFEDNIQDEITMKKEIAGVEKINTKFSVSLAKNNDTEFMPIGEMIEPVNITGRNMYPEFSGRIKYETEIEITDTNIGLDLGKVGECAYLEVNGKVVGEKIAPPYLFDISDYVTDGKNKIKIVVTNHLGYEQKDPFSAYLMLEPSGLLEPIKVVYYK